MTAFDQRPIRHDLPSSAAVPSAPSRLRGFAALLFCAGLCACTGRPEPSAASSPVPSPGATHSIAAASPTGGITESPGNVTPLAAGSVPAPLDRPRYQIDAVLDTDLLPTENGEMMQLHVEERITYTHHAQIPAGELVLQFEPARRPELFFLESLSSDRAARGGRADIRDGQLWIALEDPLAAGESIVLRLAYRRFIAREPELIGWNDVQILLGNWYAFLPPFREDAGWLAHTPGAAGEYLTYPYADFDIRLEILGGDSYQIAASGIPDGETSPLHYQFTGRSFAISLTRQMLFRRSAGPVEILAFARSEHELQGYAMADISAKTIGYFSGSLGEYPHKRFTVVESDLFDGMEFDGLVFLSPALFEYYSGDGKDYFTAITAHEAIHQWWYGRVGNDQAMEPWLDEAFAVYGELLFYEAYQPENLEWWWWTRVNRYPSDHCVDLSVYAFADFRTYVNTVYLRGAKMMHAVRTRMGKNAFLESLRDLQRDRFGLMMTSTDVFHAFQSRSPVPLADIWEEYLCQSVPAEQG